MATHVVWDWNGTLFDDIDAVAAATSEVLVEAGLAPITAAEHRRLFTRPVWVFYERLLGRPLADGEFERLDRRFSEAYERHAIDCGLAPDAWQVLRGFQRRGRSQSLLSMARHEALVPLVTKLGIQPEFVRLDGLRGPPGGHKAGHLVTHLGTLGLAGPQVLVVGDSVDDAHAAAHVGADCVLYTRGHASRDALEGAGVPVVDTLREALDHA